jgi:hypothetical protein
LRTHSTLLAHRSEEGGGCVSHGHIGTNGTSSRMNAAIPALRAAAFTTPTRDVVL